MHTFIFRAFIGAVLRVSAVIQRRYTRAQKITGNFAIVAILWYAKPTAPTLIVNSASHYIKNYQTYDKEGESCAAQTRLVLAWPVCPKEENFANLCEDRCN